jgi:phosphatidylserine decarboxylase
LALTPTALLSRTVGAAARIPLPRPLRGPLLGAFAGVAGIRVAEAEHPLDRYPTFDAFFTRRLAPGLRRWESEPGALASPVDGVVGAFGRIEGGRLIQAKGQRYTVGEFLADPGEAECFEGGLFMTIYLSPRHYHRIHTPMVGGVVSARHVPGRLFPVHAAAVLEIPRLFARNERLVCTLSTDAGRIAVVAVGATNVGRISAAFDPEWAGGAQEPVTNRARPLPPLRTYRPPVRVATGDELMTFHLGSTVVLLTEPGFRVEAGVGHGDEVRVGQTLARRRDLSDPPHPERLHPG